MSVFCKLANNDIWMTSSGGGLALSCVYLTKKTPLLTCVAVEIDVDRVVNVGVHVSFLDRRH